MSSLPTPLRRQLEGAVSKARKLAFAGATNALEVLAVHEPDPYGHMVEAARTLRRQLRAQAKQLGDGESLHKPGASEVKHLAEKLAYDQWHRLLFARYLLENNLLISPEHGVAVTLDDCEELAPALGLKDAWAVAARFAAKELPDIFRADDPAGAVELAVNDRKPLIALVTGLPLEVFTASDSLGWCYQFWQAEKKDEVNAAGNKIGADELPAVTQLFTEDYMVDFLLDNTLGAWHAGKVLAAKPRLARTAATEGELREAVALPGCLWRYLRFAQSDDGVWAPAAGIFMGWPLLAKELKCLDPCMGSGHFVVAMFERVVALRIAEEGLDEADAVAAVVGENLFGLELDPRCTQIGAFNLALAAWRRVGHCTLPALNIACSGLAPNAKRADWLKLARGDDRLERGMGRLYALFADAPFIGSLIDPRATTGDLVMAAFHELQPLLENALAQEAPDASAHEMAVTARGLAIAAKILAGQFTLVATNVPFLGGHKQCEGLAEYLDAAYPLAGGNLANALLLRIQSFLLAGCTAAVVTPQDWMLLGRYAKLREALLPTLSSRALAFLGSRAFSTIRGEVVTAALAVWDCADFAEGGVSSVLSIDAQKAGNPAEKALILATQPSAGRRQSEWFRNPNKRITVESVSSADYLSAHTKPWQGIKTSDDDRFVCTFWEFSRVSSAWRFYIRSLGDSEFSGREHVLLWEDGIGQLRQLNASQSRDRRRDVQGAPAWGQLGIAINTAGRTVSGPYLGEAFASEVVVLTGKTSILAPVLAFTQSPAFAEAIRKLDKRVAITTSTFSQVPFDLAEWECVAAEQFPHGLPQPFSSDPSQWLFNGHPNDSDQPLQVAVARLLGYQWPRQTGSRFPNCPAFGPDDLEALADADGIVPISATKGEAPAAERLRDLLARAYGKEWSTSRQQELLAQAGSAGASLEDWMCNAFFEQHCKLFQNRPFIWHIWDGHKSGFSALVNCHKLTHANLEKLTYAHLGDWIRRQQAAVDAGESGSDARLQAAKNLQATLKLILEGEPPFDLFVRWKPLAQQPIGWHPDLNDGVRMNIRPFMARDIPGGKKGAGVLRAKPNITWGPKADRGKEPARPKAEYPWFWGWDESTQDFAGVGKEPDGNRWNDCHYSIDVKRRARGG